MRDILKEKMPVGVSGKRIRNHTRMEFRSNVSLAPFTTFGIGGPATLFAEVSDASELAFGCERADADHLPVFVFSGGSNILFSDRGFPGLVMRLFDGGFRILDGGRVSVGSGRPLDEVVRASAEAGLSGMERLAGIPGSVGGAIRGNAGAFGADISDFVVSVKAFRRKSGMVKEYRKEDCGFGYRTSRFKKEPDLVILSAELKLDEGGDPDGSMALIRETVRRREAGHPQSAKCAGSFFMNPVVTDERLHDEFLRDTGSESRDGYRLPAGWLIDQVNMRGKTVGGARVSMIHPNYIVNTGDATAEDVMTLSSVVKQKVRNHLGIQLREEVELVGFGRMTGRKGMKEEKESVPDFSWPWGLPKKS
jgi:UDP-N-acetylmuramate dehydrogenase